jgi:hypothetical protein
MSETKVKETINHIIIKNKKIADFYNQHKNINIEKINLLYIELYENMINADDPSFLSKTLESHGKDITTIISIMNMNNELYKNELNNIKSIETLNSENIKNEISNLKSTINTLSSSLNTTITSKMYESKENYMKSISEILNNKENNSIINLSNTIEKQNLILVDKISIVLSDIIPKSTNKTHDDIIKYFKDDLKSTLDKLKDPENNISIDKIANIIETKYNNTILNIQEYIMKYLSLTENRLNNNLEQLKDISNKNSTLQEKMVDDFTLYLNKYKISSIKGTQGENKLYNLINKEYSSAELENTSGKTNMGDMILKRVNKQNILIETKEYSVNVKVDEVAKFIKDVNKNECSGIFLSQTSGIVGKDHFQIDINGDNILIFIHNAEYDISKIKLAINTIDFLLDKIKSKNNNDIKISSDLLNNINIEYKKFLAQKDKLIMDLKDYYKKTSDQYSEFNISSLDLLLSNHFSDSKKKILTCDICGNFNAITPKSLARHLQNCKKKDTIILQKEESKKEESKKEELKKNESKKSVL